ncbi:MAG: endonuclease MutS2 [Melioribacteraceae bacterium]|nr:endonuclease MutS2 [Melioribacteraceae bacterium]
MIRSEVLEQLEYVKVLSLIANYTSTQNGNQLILNSQPFESKKYAVEEGDLVTEAKDALIEFDYPPIEYIPDLFEAISKTKIEGVVLSTKELRSISSLLAVSRRLRQYISANTKLLKSTFEETLLVDKNLEHNINKIFTESGEISDRASSKLAEIRKEIIAKGSQLRKIVNKILKQLSDAYLVQEEYTTQRDGRIVIPVKAEHKRQERGFIHSESSTGQTVYIEPEETLELNNEILTLSFAEKREIERILRELTSHIGKSAELLKQTLRSIAKIDSVFAKAKYSLEIIGGFPTFNENEKINLINARHPLLLKKLGQKNTIPLDLQIRNDKVIIITGPNAGGKTVVLKTVGLLTLLALSGIHIPAGPDSNLHFFNNVLVDIGDKQSIEDDLSTFSSHLSNINSILNEACENSLVLLDEIGTGTDPNEGSALATSILIQLQKTGSLVLATTHHGNLKVFAHDIDGFENASMEFDTEKLVPTYKFNQGIPGSSYAFEIAKRIGFSEHLIQNAKEFMDSDKNKIENLLIDLENKSNSLRIKLNQLEIENTRLKGLTNLYEQKVERLETQKKEILEKTKFEAEEYLKDINKTVENAVRNIRESNAKKETIREAKEKIESLKKSHDVKFEKYIDKGTSSSKKIKVGDYVSVLNTNTSGELIELNNEKNKATILVGSIKLQVKVKDIISSSKPKEKSESYNPYSFNHPLQNLRLDIRGMKPETAEFEVIKYLDEAYSSGNQLVEILHGKGTGVLKNLVQEILKQHEHVKNYYFAKIEAGGEGITIVEIE